MSDISTGNFVALAQKFNFSQYKTLCDIGGAAGVLSVQVARHHKNITCTSLDLPPVAPVANEYIAAHGMSDRVKTGNVDFFKDEFPKADVITMGMILHDWDLPKPDPSNGRLSILSLSLDEHDETSNAPKSTSLLLTSETPRDSSPQ